MKFRDIIEMRINVNNLDERINENEMNDNDFDIKKKNMILNTLKENKINY